MPTKVEQAAIRAVAINGLRTLERTIEEVYPGAIARAKARVAKEKEAARFTGNPPAWAKRMVRKHGYRSTELVWRRSRVKGYSSGRCQGGWRVIVTAGGSETEQRMTLAHELAHVRGDWDGHDDSFYDALYPIARAEGLYLKMVGDRSGGYGLRRAARRARAETS